MICLVSSLKFYCKVIRVELMCTVPRIGAKEHVKKIEIPLSPDNRIVVRDMSEESRDAEMVDLGTSFEMNHNSNTALVPIMPQTNYGQPSSLQENETMSILFDLSTAGGTMGHVYCLESIPSPIPSSVAVIYSSMRMQQDRELHQ